MIACLGYQRILIFYPLFIPILPSSHFSILRARMEYSFHSINFRLSHKLKRNFIPWELSPVSNSSMIPLVYALEDKVSNSLSSIFNYFSLSLYLIGILNNFPSYYSATPFRMIKATWITVWLNYMFIDTPFLSDCKF